MALFRVDVNATSNLKPSAATNLPASVASSWPFSERGQSYQPARRRPLDSRRDASARRRPTRSTASQMLGRRRRPLLFRAAFHTSELVLEVPGRLAVAHHDDRRLLARAAAQGPLGRAEEHPGVAVSCCFHAALRESSNSQQLQDAPPRDPAGPAPRRAPEVDGRHDAPRRVDLEPREQVHWYETRRGTKAAFFSGLASETPSSGSDAVAPKRRVESRAVVSAQAGTTAPSRRRATRRPRKLEG